jgi:hypothetical protein
VTTTRSKRVVKAPANFAAEMAETMQQEHELHQFQRSARRKEGVRSPDHRDRTVSAGRQNPSQRYQEEQRRLQTQREHQERQQHARADLALRVSAQEVSVRSARRVDPEVKRQMLQVVDCADELDQEYNIFAEPVTEDVAPGYFQIIPHPVDLRTVR